MAVRWFKAIARRAVYSRAAAILTGELPAVDGTPLLQDPVHWLAGQDILGDRLRDRDQWRRLVHMTAADGLVGRSHYAELKAFISRNPEHRFFFWNDHACDWFMRRYFGANDIFRIYDTTKYGIIRADIFRLCVLKSLGGIYLDFKSNTEMPLSQLGFEGNRGYLVQTKGVIQESDVVANLRLPKAALLTNWFLAFPPDHWFLERAMEEIVNGPPFSEHERSFREWVWAFTGPRMITRVANAIWKPGIDIEILSAEESTLGLVYACKGSWVRSLIRPHYASPAYR